MSDVTCLERRYRRLLALYPTAFRREHKDETLVVLMAGARNGRRRPGLADSADLIRNARDADAPVGAATGADDGLGSQADGARSRP